MLGSIPLISGPFVAVDIETTGPRPGSSSIIDIGAVRVVDGRIVGYFSTLVTPQASIPAAIEQLTGISNTMVLQAPSVADAITQLRTFAQGAVLIAHGHRFDMSFLDYEAERIWGKPLPRPILDTLTLARRLHLSLSDTTFVSSRTSIILGHSPIIVHCLTHSQLPNFFCAWSLNSLRKVLRLHAKLLPTVARHTLLTLPPNFHLQLTFRMCLESTGSVIQLALLCWLDEQRT